MTTRSYSTATIFLLLLLLLGACLTVQEFLLPWKNAMIYSPSRRAKAIVISPTTAELASSSVDVKFPEEEEANLPPLVNGVDNTRPQESTNTVVVVVVTCIGSSGISSCQSTENENQSIIQSLLEKQWDDGPRETDVVIIVSSNEEETTGRSTSVVGSNGTIVPPSPFANDKVDTEKWLQYDPYSGRRGAYAGYAGPTSIDRSAVYDSTSAKHTVARDGTLEKLVRDIRQNGTNEANVVAISKIVHVAIINVDDDAGDDCSYSVNSSEGNKSVERGSTNDSRRAVPYNSTDDLARTSSVLAEQTVALLSLAIESAGNTPTRNNQKSSFNNTAVSSSSPPSYVFVGVINSAVPPCSGNTSHEQRPIEESATNSFATENKHSLEGESKYTAAATEGEPNYSTGTAAQGASASGEFVAAAKVSMEIVELFGSTWKQLYHVPFTSIRFVKRSSPSPLTASETTATATGTGTGSRRNPYKSYSDSALWNIIVATNDHDGDDNDRSFEKERVTHAEVTSPSSVVSMLAKLRSEKLRGQEPTTDLTVTTTGLRGPSTTRTQNVVPSQEGDKPAAKYITASSETALKSYPESSLTFPLSRPPPFPITPHRGPKTVLVTGGAGFIGSHVVDALLERGDDVVVIDELNDSYNVSIKLANLRYLTDKYNTIDRRSSGNKNESSTKNSGRLTVHIGDIANRTFLESVFARQRQRGTQPNGAQNSDDGGDGDGRPIEWVCHLAARAGVRPSIIHPQLYVHSNIDGTIQLLEMITKLNAPHEKDTPASVTSPPNNNPVIQNFVFASSSSVYGNSKARYFTEDDSDTDDDTDAVTTSSDVKHPVSPYAASKAATELVAKLYHDRYHIPTTGLRFFTVYGPRGRPDMAPYQFIDRISRGMSIDQYGDGSSSRDYTYIDDIVNGIVRALDRPQPQYEVFNLGKGSGTSLKDFIDDVIEFTGRSDLYHRQNTSTSSNNKDVTTMSPTLIRILPDQPGDVPYTCANVTKAKLYLGYVPTVSFRDGIKRTVEWYNRTYLAA